MDAAAVPDQFAGLSATGAGELAALKNLRAHLAGCSGCWSSTPARAPPRPPRSAPSTTAASVVGAAAAAMWCGQFVQNLDSVSKSCWTVPWGARTLTPRSVAAESDKGRQRLMNDDQVKVKFIRDIQPSDGSVTYNVGSEFLVDAVTASVLLLVGAAVKLTE
jgi:hypothetical protein